MKYQGFIYNKQVKKVLLGTFYKGLEIYRKEKIIYAKFLKPHLLLTTCRVNGGLRKDIMYLFNHQSCEPVGHHHMAKEIIKSPEQYMHSLCIRHGLLPDKSASLGTAANMNNAALVSKKYDDLEVLALCTGGVETNAGRAGDPAPVYEKEGRFESVAGKYENNPGTINTMIFINHQLVEGALVRAIMTATEAKTALLQELAVNSRYSEGTATGTGTDQIGVASLMTDKIPLTGAGNHTKLGELIGLAVYYATKETLVLQNKLTPGGQCSAVVHLERFGTSKKAFCEGVKKFLTEEESTLLCNNFSSINHDPLTVASVAALTCQRDKFLWGILPESCMPEILCSGGAQLAVSVSGKYHRFPFYRDYLAKEQYSSDSTGFLCLIYKAFALGFSEKWI